MIRILSLLPDKKIQKLTLDGISGSSRIKKFLKHCKNKIEAHTVLDYPHLIKYAIRYTLVKEDGELLILDTYGVNLLSVLEMSELDEVKIVSLLKDILTKNKEGCGSWVVTETIITDEQFFVFEARSENDATYLYALFLHDLGIIESFEKWSRHKDDLYYCKKTNLGQELTRIIKNEFLKNRSSQIVEDNAVKNYGLMIGGVTAGRNNDGR